MATTENTNITILDGAMGTMIQSSGLKLGQRPEIFALENPQTIENIHRMYIQSGSSVIYTNTFGANSHKLKGTGHNAAEIITANIEIAKKAAAGTNAKVALDIGPIGELIAPLGTLTFDQAYEVFSEMAIAGERAGAQVAVIETFTDLAEVRAAVLAVKENTSLPVWVTMSFEEDGRTFTGTTVEAMAVTLSALDVDAMGINCSLGPKEVLPLIKRMREWTAKPLIAKPNAGLPDPKTGSYFITPEQFATQMQDIIKAGATIVGGCCGTTPAFIKALAETAHNTAQNTENQQPCNSTKPRLAICSASTIVETTEHREIHIVGERINPTGKKLLKKALLERDMSYIMKLALSQAEAGAEILDINVGLPGIDEEKLMKEVVLAVQSVCNLPLQIDSSNTKAIEAGLRYTNGRAIVNSVNANEDRLNEILPIAKKYGAMVIGLTMDRELPKTAAERIEAAKTIIQAAQRHEIPKESLIIDCLTLTISAQQDQALQTLKAVRHMSQEMGLHTTLGVSNIAFGLPEKAHITQAFLTLALHEGLDFPIVNPNSEGIMDTVVTYRALSQLDTHCTSYIEHFSQKADAPAPEKTKPSTAMTVEEAIAKGLAQETETLTEALLQDHEGMSVINEHLIPALDKVGERYEKHQIFLPQLINSANAACKGFDVIKRSLKTNAALDKGKIIIATVEGDIHDIGKNIVKIVLENYGYKVIDLGKDVPVETVVNRTLEEGAHLVALSALMTTTVASMERTIAALKKAGAQCKTMVGGAVLTPEYARQIGADYYAKDPKMAADIAKEVLG